MHLNGFNFNIFLQKMSDAKLIAELATQLNDMQEILNMRNEEIKNIVAETKRIEDERKKIKDEEKTKYYLTHFKKLKTVWCNGMMEYLNITINNDVKKLILSYLYTPYVKFTHKHGWSTDIFYIPMLKKDELTFIKSSFIYDDPGIMFMNKPFGYKDSKYCLDLNYIYDIRDLHPSKPSMNFLLRQSQTFIKKLDEGLWMIIPEFFRTL